MNSLLSPVSMPINPLNVIQLLLVAFQTMNIPDSEVNDAERQLADHFNEILIQAMNEFNGVEIVEENTLDFSEPYKDWEPSAVEDTYAEWTPKLDSKSDDAVCTRDDENVDFDYKQRAVEFWRSGMKKSNRELSAVQHRFRKVTSVRQLRWWAGQVNKGGTYMEKLHCIAEYTLNHFKSAIDAGMIIHDVDLQKWGLYVKNILGFEDTRFKASDWWVWKFKRTHRITSRKLNKFITRKILEDKEKLKVTA